MKPEPYHAPLDRPLTEMQRLILRTSALAKGGPHPIGLSGAGQFTAARSLAAMGLGVVEGRAFTANARGVVVIAD